MIEMAWFMLGQDKGTHSKSTYAKKEGDYTGCQRNKTFIPGIQESTSV